MAGIAGRQPQQITPKGLVWFIDSQDSKNCGQDVELTGNIVPDFPLINKSFNLSYSGHDL